jgi:hypothetical protein
MAVPVPLNAQEVPVAVATLVGHHAGQRVGVVDHHADPAAARQFLASEGFPRGLANQLLKTRTAFPLRYWIVDNSGSMGISDGKKQTPRGPVQCTRWEELRETVNFHGRLADVMGSATEFRLLNPPLGGQQYVHIGGDGGAGAGAGGEALDMLLATMMTDPSGRTPLCGHLQYVHDQIVAQAGALRQHGQKAVLVIATDGVATDGDLAQMLRSFEQLPVWVVVRLCTDEDEIVEYWNNIDADIEVDMDVLDDLEGEATEVTAVNPWLNYSMPLHRAREWGMPKKAFDLLDERLLTAQEMRELCTLLLFDDGGGGGGGGGLPYPGHDWGAFQVALDVEVAQAGNTWDPKQRRMLPWISSRGLRSSYKKGGGDALAPLLRGCGGVTLVMVIGLLLAICGAYAATAFR